MKLKNFLRGENKQTTELISTLLTNNINTAAFVADVIHNSRIDTCKFIRTFLFLETGALTQTIKHSTVHLPGAKISTNVAYTDIGIFGFTFILSNDLHHIEINQIVLEDNTEMKDFSRSLYLDLKTNYVGFVDADKTAYCYTPTDGGFVVSKDGESAVHSNVNKDVKYIFDDNRTTVQELRDNGCVNQVVHAEKNLIQVFTLGQIFAYFFSSGGEYNSNRALRRDNLDLPHLSPEHILPGTQKEYEDLTFTVRDMRAGMTEDPWKSTAALSPSTVDFMMVGRMLSVMASNFDIANRVLKDQTAAVWLINNMRGKNRNKIHDIVKALAVFKVMHKANVGIDDLLSELHSKEDSVKQFFVRHKESGRLIMRIGFHAADDIDTFITYDDPDDESTVQVFELAQQNPIFGCSTYNASVKKGDTVNTLMFGHDHSLIVKNDQNDNETSVTNILDGKQEIYLNYKLRARREFCFKGDYIKKYEFINTDNEVREVAVHAKKKSITCVKKVGRGVEVMVTLLNDKGLPIFSVINTNHSAAFSDDKTVNQLIKQAKAIYTLHSTHFAPQATGLEIKLEEDK